MTRPGSHSQKGPMRASNLGGPAPEPSPLNPASAADALLGTLERERPRAAGEGNRGQLRGRLLLGAQLWAWGQRGPRSPTQLLPRARPPLQGLCPLPPHYLPIRAESTTGLTPRWGLAGPPNGASSFLPPPAGDLSCFGVDREGPAPQTSDLGGIECQRERGRCRGPSGRPVGFGPGPSTGFGKKRTATLRG